MLRYPLAIVVTAIWTIRRFMTHESRSPRDVIVQPEAISSDCVFKPFVCSEPAAINITIVVNVHFEKNTPRTILFQDSSRRTGYAPGTLMGVQWNGPWTDLKTHPWRQSDHSPMTATYDLK